MLETLIFIIAQILINLIVRIINNSRLTYVFASIAILTFGVLMLVYSTWSFNIYDFLYPPIPGPRCGMFQLSSMLFQWFIGIPIVIITQFIFNKYIHKIKNLVTKFEDTENRTTINNN
jgi:hypothetical protein